MHPVNKKIHMIGIGGAGMCPLAEVLHAHGHSVSGSDRTRTESTTRLESLGIAVQYDHEPRLVKDAQMLVYSSAIRPDNPERRYAAQNGILCARRAEVLGDLMRAHYTVCVAGTHGKTTTTSLVGAVLRDCGEDPTVLVGGIPRGSQSHATIGSGKALVAEADEFDRSFLAMYPTIAVITNIEADHLDCYRDLADIHDAFVEFANRTPFYGAVIACVDDPGVRAVLGRIHRSVLTYGLKEPADFRAGDIAFTGAQASFSVEKRGQALGTATLAIPGVHNVLNSLAAVAVADTMGIDLRKVFAAMGRFQGVRRRFEIVGRGRGITVVDDYAHHPGEIRATLDAARRMAFGRTIAVFQPHLYTRTRDFMDSFVESLSAADMVVVTSIYKAREEPIEGVSAQMIVEKLVHTGHRSSRYVVDKSDVVELLAGELRDGDAVIFMGAGDIWQTAAGLARRIDA